MNLTILGKTTNNIVKHKIVEIHQRFNEATFLDFLRSIVNFRYLIKKDINEKRHHAAYTIIDLQTEIGHWMRHLVEL